MAKFLPEEEGTDAFLARTAFNTSLLTLLEKIGENAECIASVEESIKGEGNDPT
jgi:hypothetical protein